MDYFAQNSIDLRDFEFRLNHAYNKIKWHVPAGKKYGRFLDIGCGSGNGLIAAIQHGFDSAVGIDRDFNEFEWFDISRFDELLTRYKVNPSKAIMVEGDLFSTCFQVGAFNCVMMLDSIEHVAEPLNVIRAAARYVAPGGVLILDTCPLFYSQQGGHLFNHIPNDVYPWAHLRNDFKTLVDRFSVDDWTMQRYEELNKITHDEIVKCIESTGLRIVLEDRGHATAKTLSALERNRSDLNLEGVLENWLFEDWICVVAEAQL
jgi:SAM-dependent methyltransferase